MTKKGRNKIVLFLKILLIVYLGGGIIIFLIQDLILFHPKPLAADYKFKFSQPFIEHNIPVGGNRNLNILQFTTDNKKGTVLFFHGNMRNIEHYEKYVPFITGLGYELWVMDYPGFGKSTGKRTEQALYHDAAIVYKLASVKTPKESIIIYGKSIGTGIAAQLASVKECKQLILETPYYSIAALAKHYFFMYPALPNSRYSFPTFQYVKKVQAPITILHGTDDEIIPFSQANKLKEENKHIQLITIKKGTHNNLLSFSLFRSTLNAILQ